MTYRFAPLAVISIGILAVGLAPHDAKAEVTIDVNQVGSDVVATGSGTLDLTGLTFDYSESGIFPQVWPQDAGLIVGAAGGGIDVYTGISGPAAFGSGGLNAASSGTGEAFGEYFDSQIAVPEGYASGDPLFGAATWDDTTLSGLGLTPGSYTYCWNGSCGAADDSLTINVAAVPEPGSLALLGSGLAGLAAIRRRRRKTV